MRQSAIRRFMPSFGVSDASSCRSMNYNPVCVIPFFHEFVNKSMLDRGKITRYFNRNTSLKRT